MNWNWFVKLKSIKLSIVILILQSFLLVNAPLFVKAGEVESYRFLILTYMALLIGFEAFVGQGVFKTASLGDGLFYFSIGLLGGSLVLTGGEFIGSLQTFEFARSAPVIVLITQAVVVASSEELIFRSYLPAAIGGIPSQFAFAAFHAAAYGLVLQSVFIALVAGFFFYIVAKYTSLWTAVGLHLSWNLWSLGVLSIMGVA